MLCTAPARIAAGICTDLGEDLVAICLTNQVRPHCGLIGIRLEDSKEFGPTGEESYGTNIIGKFVDDLDRLMDGLEDDDVVYITEEKI